MLTYFRLKIVTKSVTYVRVFTDESPLVNSSSNTEMPYSPEEMDGWGDPGQSHLNVEGVIE